MQGTLCLERMLGTDGTWTNKMEGLSENKIIVKWYIE